MDEVMRANCLASSNLQIGQKLYVPPTPTPTPCVRTQPAGWVHYTVQAGDTLYSLAGRSGTTVDEVMRANCLASSVLQVGQELYLPPIPTPTPCVRYQPAGWVRYTVRAGDTLYGLALTRGTTVDTVRRVNCLAGNDILTGAELYLPPLPITPEPPASPPSSTPGQVLEAWALPVGQPGGSTTIPCEEFPAEAGYALDMYPPPVPGSTNSDKDKVELGERRLFFVCNCVAYSASVQFPDGHEEPVTPLTWLPNLDLVTSTARAVIDWPVLPDHAIGPYTLTVTTNAGEPVPYYFEVITPTQGHILTVPSAGPPGIEAFTVYYVNFTLHTTQTFDLYHGKETKENGCAKYPLERCYWLDPYKRKAQPPWEVYIDEKLPSVSGGGWAKVTLPREILADATDLPVTYAIRTWDKKWRTLFWIMSPESRGFAP